MPTLEQDRDFLQAGIDELEEYLKSSVLFWKLSPAHGLLPQLTIGGLLLAAARVRGSSSSPAEVRSVEEALQQMDIVRCRWQSAWERKVGQEVHARHGLWMNYLQDYQQAPGNFAGMYTQEVRWRVMLQLLSGENFQPGYRGVDLTSLDDILRRYFLPGPFTWEPHLQKTFSSQLYWYLYGRLKKS